MKRMATLMISDKQVTQHGYSTKTSILSVLANAPVSLVLLAHAPRRQPSD